MKNLIFILVFIFCFTLQAQEKQSFDVSIDKLDFVKPAQGVGKAGTLIFKSANVLNNGIVLNVNNTNNVFDSQIFMRPTFLGFVTQLGNFGLSIEESNMINSILSADLLNSKFILDENQFSLFGESMNFVRQDARIKLKNFRVYCQNNLSLKPKGKMNNDVMSSCLKFMTLNGTYKTDNSAASIEFEGMTGKDKRFMKAQLNSIDLRKNDIHVDLPVAQIVTNDTYFINAQNVLFHCRKDADLAAIDLEKIKMPCFNKLQLEPVKAVIVDKVAHSQFDLNVRGAEVKDGVLTAALNAGVLSDAKSKTSIIDAQMQCHKSEESNLLEITNVINDCTVFGRVSIREVKSDKVDTDKDSSSKNIILNVDQGLFNAQADIKFLGIQKRVSIGGKASVDEDKRLLYLEVTNVKLPFGISSVKLLMYFLKKNMISKKIDVNNNTIIISL